MPSKMTNLARKSAQRLSNSLPVWLTSLSGTFMEKDNRIARAKFRAWHRGTREADYLFGCFFEKFHADWDEDQLSWFEALLDEDDVDVLAWALQAQRVPDKYAGTMMQRMQRLDYVKI